MYSKLDIIVAVLIFMTIFLVYMFYYNRIQIENLQMDINKINVLRFCKYLQATDDGWNYILPKEFNKMDKSKIFILDVRKPSDYQKGHIKGSVNIYWLDLMCNENLAKLPKDKEIVIVCYLGHTASQILVLLKLLGYKAKALKFGMGVPPNKNVPIAGWSTLGYEVVKT